MRLARHRRCEFLLRLGAGYASIPYYMTLNANIHQYLSPVTWHYSAMFKALLHRVLSVLEGPGRFGRLYGLPTNQQSGFFSGYRPSARTVVALGCWCRSIGSRTL